MPKIFIWLGLFCAIALESPEIISINDNCEIMLNAKHGQFLIPKNDNYIPFVLKNFGEWEEAEVQFLEQYLEEGDAVIEVGAHIGTQTIPFAKKVGGSSKRNGIVYSFEMIYNLYFFLNSNIAINSLYNVQTFNLAAGNFNGFIDSKDVDYNIESNWGAASLFHLNSNENYEQKTKYQIEKTKRIEIMMLDTLFSSQKYSNSFRCPKVFKTDAESADYLVLEGATEIINNCRPIIYSENNCLSVSKNLLSFFEQVNYDSYFHYPPIATSNNKFGVSFDYNSITHSLNVIAFPKEFPEENRVLDMYTTKTNGIDDIVDYHNLVVYYNYENGITREYPIKMPTLKCG